MKIVIPGGTGQIGGLLARTFHGEGHEVVVLSRHPRANPWLEVAWDGATAGGWMREIDGSDVVINLAGRSVNCRYGRVNRRAILSSRVLSTRVIGQAVASAKSPPRVWLQASTATIYAHRFEGDNDEDTGILGGQEPSSPDEWKFSIKVATAWERAFNEAAVPRIRKVALRSAMTMAPDRGGVFDTLSGLVRHGLGGSAGHGRQFVSWIHYEDFISAMRWLIDHDDISGPVNVAAPHPLPNAEFMQLIREAYGVSFGLPASNWMLEVGAVFLRTETELILKSRRVFPGILVAHGFQFKFPNWREAALDLSSKWKTLRASEPRAA